MKDYRRQAKILLFDLEISPTLGWTYGQYQVNVVRQEMPPVLLSVAWKWLGSKNPECLTINDLSVDPFNDTALVQRLWQLLDEAEIIVAHNLNKFDRKMANSFFLRHGMKPPRFYKTFDTLQTARKYFKLDNNKLDYLGGLLCGEHKTSITCADVWHDMLYGNQREQRKASVLMKEYNIQDVVLLEKIYEKLLPYADNHPNTALAAGIDYICPKCGYESDFKVKAYRKTAGQINAIQYECKHCHGYVTRPLTKEERVELNETGQLKPTFRNVN